jgi:PAS domain S-box-containing protein
MKSSLWSKFAVGFILAVPVLVVLDFVQLLSFLNLIGAGHQAARTSEVRAEVEATLSDLKDVEVAVKGTFPGAEADQVQACESAISAVQGDLQLLGRLTGVDPARQGRLRKLEAQVGLQIDQLEQVSGSGSPEKPKERERGKVFAERQKALRPQMQQLTEEIRSFMADWKTEQLRLLPARNTEASKAERKVIYLTGFVGVLTLWLVAVAALLIRRAASERKWGGLERRMHAQVLATLPMGVCVADDGGVIFYTNPAEDALLGYPPGELMGRNIVDFLGKPPEENVQLADEIAGHLESRGFWRGEVTALKKNGLTFTSHTYAVAMRMAGKAFRVLLQEEMNEPGKT